MDAMAGELVALARQERWSPARRSAPRPGHPVRPDLGGCAGRAGPAADRRGRGQHRDDVHPGPRRALLDLLLADVLKRGQGAVRMVFNADAEGHLSSSSAAPRCARFGRSWTYRSPRPGRWSPRSVAGSPVRLLRTSRSCCRAADCGGGYPRSRAPTTPTTTNAMANPISPPPCVATRMPASRPSASAM